MIGPASGFPSPSRRPDLRMNHPPKITVRFLCPWREHRPGEIVTMPQGLAAELIRVHIANPAGRIVETTARATPIGTETRVLQTSNPV